jgi:hypothetical protein
MREGTENIMDIPVVLSTPNEIDFVITGRCNLCVHIQVIFTGF